MQLLVFAATIFLQFGLEFQYEFFHKKSLLNLKMTTQLLIFTFVSFILFSAITIANGQEIGLEFLIGGIVFSLVAIYEMQEIGLLGGFTRSRSSIARISIALSLICLGCDAIAVVLATLSSMAFGDILNHKLPSLTEIPRVSQIHKAGASALSLVIFVICQVQEWTMTIYNIVDFIAYNI